MLGEHRNRGDNITISTKLQAVDENYVAGAESVKGGGAELLFSKILPSDFTSFTDSHPGT